MSLFQNLHHRNLNTTKVVAIKQGGPEMLQQDFIHCVQLKMLPYKATSSLLQMTYKYTKFLKTCWVSCDACLYVLGLVLV